MFVFCEMCRNAENLHCFTKNHTIYSCQGLSRAKKFLRRCFDGELWREKEALKAAQQLIRFLLTQPHLSVTMFLHARTWFLLSLSHTHFFPVSPHSLTQTCTRREDSSPLTTVKDSHVYRHHFREVRYTNKSPLTDWSPRTYFFNCVLRMSGKGSRTYGEKNLVSERKTIRII